LAHNRSRIPYFPLYFCGELLVSTVGTFIAENLPFAQGTLFPSPTDAELSFSGVSSIQDLHQQIKDVINEMPPPSLATGATGPYNVNAILERIANDFTYIPNAQETDVLLAFSELQGGFGEEFKQFQANLPTTLALFNLIATHSELIPFVNSALEGLGQRQIDPTRFLLQFTSQPPEQLDLLLSVLNNPLSTDADIHLLAQNYGIMSSLANSAESLRLFEDNTRALEIYNSAGMVNSQGARDAQNVVEREQGRGGLYTLVRDDPSLLGDLATSPVITQMLHELFQSEQLQQVVSSMISNELLSGEGGVITGILQDAVSQAVDARLREYGFQLPTIDAPATRDGFVNPSTAGQAPTLTDASGQQVVPIELFAPIDEAVRLGIYEVEQTGQFISQDTASDIQRVVLEGIAAIEDAQRNAISAILAQHTLLAAANTVLPTLRRGYSSDQQGVK